MTKDMVDAILEQGRLEERAKIVAWLRGPDPYPDAHDIADAIEAGEHTK